MRIVLPEITFLLFLSLDFHGICALREEYALPAYTTPVSAFFFQATTLLVAFQIVPVDQKTSAHVFTKLSLNPGRLNFKANI